MPHTYTNEQLSEFQGTPVFSSDGEKIGAVEEIYYDLETRRPEWFGIGTGFLRMKRVLVPIETASFGDDEVRVPYDKDMVTNSPDVNDDQIGQDLERDLTSYYGVGYSESRSSTGLPEGTGAGMPATTRTTKDDETSLTRSEEELAVGKRRTEAGKVRLKKWVETEPVEEQVELRHETARVRREPVDREADAGAIGEREVEVPLEAEQPVVEKRTVAKERVSVDKGEETDTESVTGEVRKERVDVEGDDIDERRVS
jgi:uncharacterized protein (TIGR02271 family)